MKAGARRIRDFDYTDRKVYLLEGKVVVVEVENTTSAFRWRMLVNGKASPVTGHYDGILKFEDFYLASAYWDGIFPEFVPFRVNGAKITTAQETPR